MSTISVCQTTAYHNKYQHKHILTKPVKKQLKLSLHQEMLLLLKINFINFLKLFLKILDRMDRKPWGGEKGEHD